MIITDVLDHGGLREKVNSSGMTCSPLRVNHIGPYSVNENNRVTGELYFRTANRTRLITGGKQQMIGGNPPFRVSQNV